MSNLPPMGQPGAIVAQSHPIVKTFHGGVNSGTNSSVSPRPANANITAEHVIVIVGGYDVDVGSLFTGCALYDTGGSDIGEAFTQVEVVEQTVGTNTVCCAMYISNAAVTSGVLVAPRATFNSTISRMFTMWWSVTNLRSIVPIESSNDFDASTTGPLVDAFVLRAGGVAFWGMQTSSGVPTVTPAILAEDFNDVAENSYGVGYSATSKSNINTQASTTLSSSSADGAARVWASFR